MNYKILHNITAGCTRDWRPGDKLAHGSSAP